VQCKLCGGTGIVTDNNNTRTDGHENLIGRQCSCWRTNMDRFNDTPGTISDLEAITSDTMPRDCATCGGTGRLPLAEGNERCRCLLQLTDSVLGAQGGDPSPA
jgi:hypothetical protein